MKIFVDRLGQQAIERRELARLSSSVALRVHLLETQYIRIEGCERRPKYSNTRLEGGGVAGMLVEGFQIERREPPDRCAVRRCHAENLALGGNNYN